MNISDLVRQLEWVKDKFGKQNVMWALFAGAAAFAYGGKRTFSDLDIIIPRRHAEQASVALGERFHKVRRIFKEIEIDSNLASAGSIEVASSLVLTDKNQAYSFEMDGQMIRRRKRKAIFGVIVPLLSVEDNIVFKAILQRGKEDGKRDLEDIMDMTATRKIDVEYLNERIRRCKAEKRIEGILQKILNYHANQAVK